MLLTGFPLEKAIRELLENKKPQTSHEWCELFNTRKGIEAIIVLEVLESKFAGSPSFQAETDLLEVNNSIRVNIKTKEMIRMVKHTFSLSKATTSTENSDKFSSKEPWAGAPYPHNYFSKL